MIGMDQYPTADEAMELATREPLVEVAAELVCECTHDTGTAVPYGSTTALIGGPACDDCWETAVATAVDKMWEAEKVVRNPTTGELELADQPERTA